MKKMLVALGTLIALSIGIQASFASCPCTHATPCSSCAKTAPCCSSLMTDSYSYYVVQPTGFACPCTSTTCNSCCDSCDSCCDKCNSCCENKCPEKCRWWKFWQDKNCCEKCNKCDSCCD